MTFWRPNATHPSMTGPLGLGGVGFILLGLACLMVGLVFDGGFFGGLSIGAAIGFMVLGTYLVGASARRGSRAERDLQEREQWLPSRDSTTDRTDR